MVLHQYWGRWDSLLQLLKVFAEPEPEEQVGPSHGLPFSAGAIRGTAHGRFLQLTRTWGCPLHSPCPSLLVGAWSTSPFVFWQELNSEMRQHQEDLAVLEHLAAELGSCGFAPGASQQQEKLQSLKKDFLQLQKVAKER